MVILVNTSHAPKAYAPIVVTLSGIFTLTNSSQS